MDSKADKIIPDVVGEENPSAEKASAEKAPMEKLSVENPLAEKLPIEKPAIEKPAIEKLAIEKSAIASGKKGKQKKPRIELLDELRGLAVLCMVFYHGFYLAYFFLGIEDFFALFKFFMPVQPFFAGIFIVISGISSRLSRSNFKRGARLLLISLGITLITCVLLPKMDINGAQDYFGILHLLSCCMLVWALISSFAIKLKPVVPMVVCAVLYLFTANVSDGFLGFGELLRIPLPDALYSTDLLMPLGFFSRDFFSADYFPLLPWLFLFLVGAFMGDFVVKGLVPHFAYQRRVPFLAFLGRNSLYVYILHYPAILLILLIVSIFI